MKILQIHNYYKHRGGESFVLNSEKELLEKKGHSVLQLTADNMDIRNIIFERFNFYKRLSKIIEENNIDVAHVHNIYQIIGPSLYRYFQGKGIPVVQTLHNFRFLCINGLFLDNKNKICELCINGGFSNSKNKKCYQKSKLKSLLMANQVNKGRINGLKFIDQFIALNDFAKNKMILGGFEEQKISIKPNFLTEGNSKIIEDKEYALYIGRISEEKGLDVLIKAFSKINFKLKIAGTGNYLPTVKKLAKNYQNIEFLDHISGAEKESYISKCSFFVVPSKWYEMFPISILEAYQNSKPVIASDLGGLSKIVEDGVTGFFI